MSPSSFTVTVNSFASFALVDTSLFVFTITLKVRIKSTSIPRASNLTIIPVLPFFSVSISSYSLFDLSNISLSSSALRLSSSEVSLSVSTVLMFSSFVLFYLLL